jgi:hypothetical protein
MEKFKFSFGMIYDIIPATLLILFGVTNPVLIISSISLLISRLLLGLNRAQWLMLIFTVIYTINSIIGAFLWENLIIVEKAITVLILAKSTLLISKISGELYNY